MLFGQVGSGSEDDSALGASGASGAVYEVSGVFYMVGLILCFVVVFLGVLIFL